MSKAMKEEQKTFEEFLEQVAKEYGFHSWEHNKESFTLAVLRYGKYREEHGRKQGYNQALEDVIIEKDAAETYFRQITNEDILNLKKH